jgi:hypothetical protein
MLIFFITHPVSLIAAWFLFFCPFFISGQFLSRFIITDSVYLAFKCMVVTMCTTCRNIKHCYSFYRRSVQDAQSYGTAAVGPVEFC